MLTAGRSLPNKMKFLAATLAVALVALPIAVKGQVLTFAAYDSERGMGRIGPW
ncbi:hypothetical protein CALVIDRAFT_532693 [Calocera viscosa TUFC12733]|uniref:Uncharacterized protein n=1 Tax=Calocera viscosa (strain TUFC12733) TaxID=1330018 RepID=A0A167RMK4_CALVF|nr:hypothetical protein CALVIDRAFT_532693 [Calocera viscosa TUFC12733]